MSVEEKPKDDSGAVFDELFVDDVDTEEDEYEEDEEPLEDEDDGEEVLLDISEAYSDLEARLDYIEGNIAALMLILKEVHARVLSSEDLANLFLAKLKESRKAATPPKDKQPPGRPARIPTKIKLPPKKTRAKRKGTTSEATVAKDKKDKTKEVKMVKKAATKATKTVKAKAAKPVAAKAKPAKKTAKKTVAKKTK